MDRFKKSETTERDETQVANLPESFSKQTHKSSSDYFMTKVQEYCSTTGTGYDLGPPRGRRLQTLLAILSTKPMETKTGLE